jgi:hypothetical protein
VRPSISGGRLSRRHSLRCNWNPILCRYGAFTFLASACHMPELSDSPVRCVVRRLGETKEVRSAVPADDKRLRRCPRCQ